MVYLQPTSPLRKISQLTYALKEVIKKKYDASWSISEVDKKFHPKKILKLTNKNYLSIYEKSGKIILQDNNLKKFILEMEFFIFSKFQNFYKVKIFILKKIILRLQIILI